MNKLSTLRGIITVLVCIFVASSCSSEDENDALAEGEYPITFASSVEGLKTTRATSEGTWNSGDEIGIEIAGTVKKYTAATADGKLTIASGADPFYWQSQSETKSVQGWYPYSATTPNVWAVQPDQSAVGYQESDLLCTPATNITFVNRSTPLKFYHQTTKVVINIESGEAVTIANQIKKVVIGDANNIHLNADYTAPSSNVSQGTWANLNTMGAITPKVLTPTESYLKSYTALLIPQNMGGKKFIAVTLSNGNTYYYTPTTTEGDLQGGKQHTYNITIMKGYLEVEALTGGQWTNDGNETIISKTVYTANDLKPGDFYYDDGTWSDGGLRKLDANGIGEIETNTIPITGKTVVGIVFWTGDPTEGIHNNGTPFTDFGDPALKNEMAHCTHGLVVALQDASATKMKWQATATDVSSWATSNSYSSIATGYGDTDPLNKLRGYNNTQAIRAYNASVGSGSQNLVLPVQAIDTWAVSNTAPANSSGWYLPSPKELSLLCSRDVNNIWNNNSGGTGMRDIVNASISKVGSSATAIQSSWYWSSSENVVSTAWVVGFSVGDAYYYGKPSYFSVRGVSAF